MVILNKAGMADPKLLQFGIPIPYDDIEDKTVMRDLRLSFKINLDMPGAMENVHPNKFIANLRPVEEFRHTPLIPISDKEMSKFHKERDARNRQGYFVEIKKDTIYYYSMITFMFLSVGYAFYITHEKQLASEYNVTTHKIGRYNTAKGSLGLGILDDRRIHRIPDS